MTAPYKIAAFLGERRKFFLDLEQAELLEGSVDCGVFVLEAIFKHGQHRIKHIRQVLTHALIGGGMDEDEAIGLVERGVKAGALARYTLLCHVILVNFIGPLDDEDDDSGKKPKPPQSEGEGDSSSDPTDNSHTEG